MKILVTGATSGIGQALVEQYSTEEHTIYACGRNSEKLEQLKTSNPNVVPLQFDVNSDEERTHALNEVNEIDLVILNAGDCEYIDDVLKFDATMFERIVQTNLISIAYLLEILLPKISKGGQLVLVGSSVTLCPFPRAEAYGASKAGLSYLANSLRLDLLPHNISVCLVEPGFVATPLTDKNDFDMPFKVSSQSAAQTIKAGIKKGKERIRFPNKLMLSLKLLAMLPTKLLANILSK
jgi:short-subunit dehydrogenase